MRDAIVALIVLGWVPVAFFRPYVGVLVWFWLSHMYPQAETYGFAMTFPFLDLVAASTIGGILLDRNQKSIPFHPIVVAISIYFVWVICTTIFAFDPANSVSKLTHFFKVILFTYIVMLVMQSPNRLKALIFILLLSMAYISVKGGAYTVLSGGGGRVQGGGGMMEDNNQLAVAMAMSFPLGLFLYHHPPKPFLKWPLFGLAMSFPITVVGTQSRGGFAALAAVGFMLLMKTKRKFTVLTLMLVLGSAGFYFAPDNWKNRIQSTEKTTEDDSFRGRVVMWKFSANLADDNPIEGGGFDVFYVRRAQELYMTPGEQSRAPHSIYFEVLAEHGYTGLVLWLTMLFTGWYAGGTAAKRYRQYEETHWLGDLCAACQLSFVGYAAGGLTVNISTFDYFYDLLAFVVISGVIGERIIAKGVTDYSGPNDEEIQTRPKSKKWSPPRPTHVAARRSS